MAKKKTKLKNKIKKIKKVEGITVKEFDKHIKTILASYPPEDRKRFENYFTSKNKKLIVESLKDFHKLLAFVVNIESNEIRISVLKTMKLNIEQAIVYDRLKDLEKIMKGRIVNIKKLDNMEAMEFFKTIFG